ncbi:hypothetical protein C8R47DRAFT_1074043 [Mycena vitilis]|nr:hypothetical protein C8R47DRAFT_1074043 [Mycena vitilis]
MSGYPAQLQTHVQQPVLRRKSATARPLKRTAPTSSTSLSSGSVLPLPSTLPLVLSTPLPLSLKTFTLLSTPSSSSFSPAPQAAAAAAAREGVCEGAGGEEVEVDAQDDRDDEYYAARARACADPLFIASFVGHPWDVCGIRALFSSRCSPPLGTPLEVPRYDRRGECGSEQVNVPVCGFSSDAAEARTAARTCVCGRGRPTSRFFPLSPSPLFVCDRARPPLIPRIPPHHICVRPRPQPPQISPAQLTFPSNAAHPVALPHALPLAPLHTRTRGYSASECAAAVRPPLTLPGIEGEEEKEGEEHASRSRSRERWSPAKIPFTSPAASPVSYRAGSPSPCAAARPRHQARVPNYSCDRRRPRNITQTPPPGNSPPQTLRASPLPSTAANAMSEDSIGSMEGEVPAHEESARGESEEWVLYEDGEKEERAPLREELSPLVAPAPLSESAQDERFRPRVPVNFASPFPILLPSALAACTPGLPLTMISRLIEWSAFKFQNVNVRSGIVCQRDGSYSEVAAGDLHSAMTRSQTELVNVQDSQDWNATLLSVSNWVPPRFPPGNCRCQGDQLLQQRASLAAQGGHYPRALQLQTNGLTNAQRQETGHWGYSTGCSATFGKIGGIPGSSSDGLHRPSSKGTEREISTLDSALRTIMSAGTTAY